MCETHDNKDIVTPSEKDGDFELFKYDINESGIDGLIGSEILKFGTIKNERRKLGIEYRAKDGLLKRVIFEFDETGIFIDMQS